MVGGTGIILTKPDPPLALNENTAVRTATNIGLVWSEGTSNGGTPVIDYRIWYD